MRKKFLIVAVFLLIVCSLSALKIKAHSKFKYVHISSKHQGSLINFTYAVTNANFTGVSGTYFNDRLVTIQLKFVDKDSGE